MTTHRLAGPSGWRNDAFTRAAVIGGALLLAHLARALGDLGPRPVDFSIFYIAARGWLRGQALYAAQAWQEPLVNYNPPHFHVLVLPLAVLPLSVAFIVWTAGSGLLAWLTARLAIRESGIEWTRRDRAILAAGVLTAAGVGATLRVGQVSWYLAFIVTLAWRAARRGRWPAAGAWLGIAIGWKPFLLLFVPVLMFRRQWLAAGVAVAVAVGSALGGAAVFGWPALQSWLDLLRTPAPVHQVAYFINGSWAAIVARSTLPAAVAVAGSVAIAAMTLFAVRKVDEDRAWLLTIVASLLASPLGWVYYTPLLLGPLAVLAQARRLPSWAWWVWPLLAFPPFSREAFQQATILAVLPGSIYTWGFIGLWCAVLRALPAPDRVNPLVHTPPAFAAPVSMAIQ